MGDEEYNNLGHHVYIRNEDGDYDELLPVKTIADPSETIESVSEAFLKFSKAAMEFTVAYNDLLTHLLPTNNWRKMHGLPMRRKIRKQGVYDRT